MRQPPRSKDDSGKSYRFGGFRSPRYTQVPDEAFDELMAVLTPAEFKVMMYVIRRTFGFKKDSDAISLSQIVSGLRTTDGRVLDRGTGLSKSGAVKAIKGLLAKEVVVAARRSSATHGHQATIYQLHFAEEQTRRPSEIGSSRPPLVRSVDKGILSTEDTSPCAPNRQALVHSPDTQETEEQDTEDTSLLDLAAGFLASVGYGKPSKAKRERTLRILQRLHTEDGYSLEVIREACRIAVSMGARGPELIPHVIGREEPAQPEPGVGKRLAEAEAEARDRWEAQTTAFDALPEQQRQQLIQQAKVSNPIIAQRPQDHPLVRAAAIALLGG
jgi:hypothetical protein